MKVVQINLVEAVKLYFVSRKNLLYDEQLWGHKGRAWRGPAHQHMKVVRFSVLRTGRLYPAGNISDAHFC